MTHLQVYKEHHERWQQGDGKIWLLPIKQTTAIEGAGQSQDKSLHHEVLLEKNTEEQSPELSQRL